MASRVCEIGAPSRNRTCDQLLRRQLLYPLSYGRNWSGRRDSNPRHPAWKASALPTELLPHSHHPRMVGARGFEPPTFWSQTRRAAKLRYAPERTEKYSESFVCSQLSLFMRSMWSRENAPCLAVSAGKRAIRVPIFDAHRSFRLQSGLRNAQICMHEWSKHHGDDHHRENFSRPCR